MKSLFEKHVICMKEGVLLFLLLICSYFNPTNSGAVLLNAQNFDNMLAENQLVFINFYADWCKFSQILAPVFDEAADKIKEEFPSAGQVLFGRVDCDKETGIATRFHVTKYPTLKVIQNGKVMKKEYRGKRSVEAFTEHVRHLLTDPIKYINEANDWNNIDVQKPGIIARLDRSSNATYQVVRKVAFDLRDDCQFYVQFRDPVEQPGNNIAFKPAKLKIGEKDEYYTGAELNGDELNAWALHRCAPLVREITFDNAEELTEEGLPFLILFHHPDDKASVELYNKIVLSELLNEKDSINFLTADGIKFSHPLHHLGKSNKDLPLLAIDSFRHMYMLPKFQDITIPGTLKKFTQDLYTGKLHREFHYGPDPTEAVDNNVVQQGTSPPDSTFRKLGPSRNRYTLLKDEL